MSTTSASPYCSEDQTTNLPKFPKFPSGLIKYPSICLSTTRTAWADHLGSVWEYCSSIHSFFSLSKSLQGIITTRPFYSSTAVCLAEGAGQLIKMFLNSLSPSAAVLSVLSVPACYLCSSTTPCHTPQAWKHWEKIQAFVLLLTLYCTVKDLSKKRKENDLFFFFSAFSCVVFHHPGWGRAARMERTLWVTSAAGRLCSTSSRPWTSLSGQTMTSAPPGPTSSAGNPASTGSVCCAILEPNHCLVLRAFLSQNESTGIATEGVSSENMW